MRSLLLPLLLVACGASAKQVTGPDGSPGWYEIECSSDHNACLEKARTLCTNGFEVSTSEGKTQKLVSDAMAGPPESGVMLMRCR